MSMVIAKAYPKLNIVVEDLPEVVRDAEKVCQPACLIIKGFLHDLRSSGRPISQNHSIAVVCDLFVSLLVLHSPQMTTAYFR